MDICEKKRPEIVPTPKGIRSSSNNAARQGETHIEHPETGQQRFPIAPINVSLRHLLVPSRSACRDDGLSFKKNELKFSRMQREQPSHHGETFRRGHPIHRHVERPPFVATREQRLIENPWRNPMITPARSDKDDIDVILLLGKSVHLERNPIHWPREELVNAGTNENENENADQPTERIPGKRLHRTHRQRHLPDAVFFTVFSIQKRRALWRELLRFS